MLLKLKPVLGSFLLLTETKPTVGERNSTRWIIDILQDPGQEAENKLSKGLCASFSLVHGSAPQQGKVHDFSFGAHHPGMYDARPVLDYDEKTRLFRVTALPVEGPTAYRLSIDILHSMHR